MIHLIFNLKHEMEFDRKILLLIDKNEFADNIEALVDIEYKAFKVRVDNRIKNYLNTLQNEK